MAAKPILDGLYTFTFISIFILFWHLYCILTIASPCLSEQETMNFLLKFRKIAWYVMPQTASLILKKRTVWAEISPK